METDTTTGGVAIESTPLLALVAKWEKAKDERDTDGADSYQRGYVNGVAMCVSDLRYEIRKANESMKRGE
jgi:hypothetical protein